MGLTGCVCVCVCVCVCAFEDRAAVGLAGVSVSVRTSKASKLTKVASRMARLLAVETCVHVSICAFVLANASVFVILY